MCIHHPQSARAVPSFPCECSDEECIDTLGVVCQRCMFAKSVYSPHTSTYIDPWAPRHSASRPFILSSASISAHPKVARVIGHRLFGSRPFGHPAPWQECDVGAPYLRHSNPESSQSITVELIVVGLIIVELIIVELSFVESSTVESITVELMIVELILVEVLTVDDYSRIDYRRMNYNRIDYRRIDYRRIEYRRI